MAITVRDIQEKEFKHKVRGYDDAEVDEFLDEISEEMEILIKDNKELKSRLESSGEQLGYMRNLEATLRDTLVIAQRTADETVADAQKKARRILESAEEQANRTLAEAREEAARITGSLGALRAQANEFRMRFGRLLEEQARVIKESDVYDGDEHDEDS